MVTQPVVSRPAALPSNPFGVNPLGFGPPAQEVQVDGAMSVSFWICVAYTFLICSRTVEFIDYTGRLHINMILGLICIVALIATGGFVRMLISNQGKWLTLLSFWIFFGLPFSTWRGGSMGMFTGTWIKSYLTFFIVGGLIFSLAQLRTMSIILALSTVSQVYLAFKGGILSAQSEDRLMMAYGTLGNSNDLATALLLGLPYMFFCMSDRKLNPVLRIAFVPLSVMLLIAMLRTGSRGGLIAVTALILFAFFKASSGSKFGIALAAITFVVVFVAVVPDELRNRYMTIFASDRNAATSISDESALESSDARKGLLLNALILSARNPLFGVGIGQFAPQSFNLFVERGVVGLWFTCHDIFGLVAAECGLPSLVFYCALLWSSARSLLRLSKIPATTPELTLVSRLAFTLMMSLLVFTVCGIFGTNAFSFQLPVIAALVAALERLALPHIAASARVLSGDTMAPPVAAQYIFANRRFARPVRTA